MIASLPNQKELVKVALKSIKKSELNARNLLLRKKYYKQKIEYLKEAQRSFQPKSDLAQPFEDISKLFSFSENSVFHDDQLIREIITLMKKRLPFIHANHLLNIDFKSKTMEMKILQYKISFERRKQNAEKEKEKDNSNSDKELLEEVKKEVFQSIGAEMNETSKKIKTLKQNLKKEVFDEKLDLEKEIKDFEQKTMKKYYAGEIRVLLDKICNKNLIFDDFEFSSSEHEDLILLNLSFLVNEQKFKKYYDLVCEEKDKNPKLEELYQNLKENLVKLKEVLKLITDGSPKKKNAFNGEYFFNKEKKEERKEEKKNKDSFENMNLNSNMKIKAYLRLVNYVGKNISDCQILIKDEIKALNEKIGEKLLILKKHFKIFKQEYAELEKHKEFSKEILIKNEKKLENIETEVKKEESERKKLEENFQKLKKKYKSELLKEEIRKKADKNISMQQKTGI